MVFSLGAQVIYNTTSLQTDVNCASEQGSIMSKLNVVLFILRVA